MRRTAIGLLLALIVVASALPASAAHAVALTEEQDARVEQTLSSMTLHKKICQMIVARPATLAGGSSTRHAGSALKSALGRYPVGGLFYNTENMGSKAQIKKMLKRSQKYSPIDMLTMCDEEGGRVGRLMRTVGTTRIGSMYSYHSKGARRARKNARIIGRDMSALGFNMDLAPVADVWSNPHNTVIGDRAYSKSYKQAAKLIPAAVRGFHDGGVACVLKHFPGHGNTLQDSHYGAAKVRKSLDALRTQDLLPFRAGIDAGADAVMLGHLTLTKEGNAFVPFSRKIVTRLLRDEMGFDGIVMTDALEMRAITCRGSTASITRRCVKAGVDMLLCPNNIRKTVKALKADVRDGRISVRRINKSVRRILRVKAAHGLL